MASSCLQQKDAIHLGADATCKVLGRVKSFMQDLGSHGALCGLSLDCSQVSSPPTAPQGRGSAFPPGGMALTGWTSPDSLGPVAK